MRHVAHANRKQYWFIWGYLLVLTLAEVGVANLSTVSKSLVVSALLLLAVVKAALVGLFYMHLVHETNVLKWTVAIPLASPVLYAVVLIAEASWRHP
ncbi:MAG TPA: cytochrome C oxidase subunit IV family protein [Polyangiaceae bacterium]|nr:cytochrome C oxidase subunit IV family protein [Polyangiaceae bacterium]